MKYVLCIGLHLIWIVITVTALTCPPQCQCGRDFEPYEMPVACEGLSIEQLPKLIPDNVTDLALANNKFTTLKKSQFESLRSIRALYLQHNMFEEIDEDTAHVIAHLPELSVINLSYNRLNCRCSRGMKMFLQWFIGKKAERLSATTQGLGVVDAYATLCEQPHNLKGRRLDSLKLNEVC